MIKPGIVLSYVVCLFAAPIPSASADVADARVGVFDQQAVGGQGAGVEGLVRGLKEMGYRAETFMDLSLLTLARYDSVYLSDMHHPGPVAENWRKSLAEYVAAGGSVLQTWHHHIFGEVARGVERVYGKRKITVTAGHPAVKGISDFQTSYSDHIVESVGPKGTVLLSDEDGRPVAAAGTLGRGKVISTGIALAIPGGSVSSPPRGEERKLVEAFLKWLAPEVPREERLAAAMQEPQLSVSPPKALTAAGFPARFHVAAGWTGADRVEIACDGASVEAGETVTVAPGALRSVTLTVPTSKGDPGLRELTVRAKLGDRTLEEKVAIASVYGKPPAKEIRGVWLHVREDRHPKDVMPELKRLGINTAVLRIAGGTAAFYASRVGRNRCSGGCFR